MSTPSDIDPKFTRSYWNHRQLAQGLGLSRGHLYRLLENGQMLPPDIVVAPENYGWDPGRARRFGADTDRLDADGRPLGQAPDGGLAQAEMLIKTRYAVRPKVYLSSWLVSHAYGLGSAAVYFMRKRDNFIPADVVVGQQKMGWSEPRVIEFGEQTGRMDDAKIDHWAFTRTAEHGLSPDIPWVQSRASKSPALRKELEKAVAAWEKKQEEEEERRHEEAEKAKTEKAETAGKRDE